MAWPSPPSWIGAGPATGSPDTVTVFKLSTLEVQKVVKTTGENPDAILYEPATKRVFTFNGRGKNATVYRCPQR